ncbi:ParB/RepB/Spo0J family partition protein [Tepidibacillus sp. HK-1]|uniref:ParB/RepB/Spo0J family partition protein n=1 Tax=Tepidibacillus sp. HK-1 TaxID=1883407 RepID=UPI0008533B25|nr:ParB/RepB/Spo0J family partition protein [Tepidibacillus sp. HK-1]GBF11466.1 putative chromosome-partitioning protein ParB [Tepidibacillus sp. HK-1]
MSKRLGRGLDALIPSLNIDEKDQISELEVAKIRPNPYQPRKNFDDGQLSELMASIKEHGVIQPIVVRKSLNGYEIVAGERRWRATKALNLEKIPVVIKEFSDQQVMEIALIENLQRENLNPIEIANAYAKLMQQFNLTQEELAAKVGKSRPNVANFMRLLQLPNEIQSQLGNGNLSMGHARALISLEHPEQQKFLCNKVITENWSVRTLEEKIKSLKENVSRETTKKKETINPIYKQLEDQLRNRFKTAVKIKTGKNKGKIEIEYFNQSDLNRILEMLGIEE